MSRFDASAKQAFNLGIPFGEDLFGPGIADFFSSSWESSAVPHQGWNTPGRKNRSATGQLEVRTDRPHDFRGPAGQAFACAWHANHGSSRGHTPSVDCFDDPAADTLRHFESGPEDVAAGSALHVAVRFNVQATKEQVTVSSDQAGTVSLDSDDNANAIVIQGPDLEAASALAEGGLFAASDTKHRYNLTIGIIVRNLFNDTNAGTPVGDLSSPYFGRSNWLASTADPADMAFGNNRRVQFQLRFDF